jgi:hypothetical protein
MPAGTLNKKVGTKRQAFTNPKWSGEFVNCNTAQFKATKSIQSPTRVTKLPDMKILNILE